MKVQLLDQQIYFIQESNNTFDSVTKFIEQTTFHQNPYSIIVELPGIESALDFTALSRIQKKLQKLKLILVLVSPCDIPDFLSVSIIGVPTLTEAIDYIQFDRIQKGLLD